MQLKVLDANTFVYILYFLPEKKMTENTPNLSHGQLRLNRNSFHHYYYYYHK
jgi:hypothetical protein